MDGGALHLIWGEQAKPDVFGRWMQGFCFSPDEALALLQFSGGPCAVIAPVQAFMIQRHLFASGDVIAYDSDEWRKCLPNDAYLLLLNALCDILLQAVPSGQSHIAVLKDKSLLADLTSCACKDTNSGAAMETTTQQQMLDSCAEKPSEQLVKEDSIQSAAGLLQDEGTMSVQQAGSSADIRHQVASMKVNDPTSSVGIAGGNSSEGKTVQFTSGMLVAALQNVSRTLVAEHGSTTGLTEASLPGVVSDVEGGPGEKRPRLDLGINPPAAILKPDSLPSDIHDKFHSNIRIIDCSCVQQTLSTLADNITDYQGPFGVILFLYSVILTKGLGTILEEVEDRNEPLIDSTYGHGSHSLVNLLLTGRAVTNVFDNEQEISGLALKGVERQSFVGFLTILEALRYCQVGSFLKSPRYPVWVIGSETHLTVVFSTERNLVSEEPADAIAKREFKKFDKEDNNFIATESLGDLLRQLDLETDSEYVDFMKKRLDPDELGIILLNVFLDEFFPQNDLPHVPPKAFIIYHYNGLTKLQDGGKQVKFAKGAAAVLDEETGMSSDVTLLNCLHTKWPGLVVTWEDQTSEPSII